MNVIDDILQKSWLDCRSHVGVEASSSVRMRGLRPVDLGVAEVFLAGAAVVEVGHD